MEEITNKKNCYGCTACVNICPKKAIKMVEDSRGFKYPSIDDKLCINCGLCKRRCPANKELNDFLDYSVDPIIYAAKCKDDNIRNKSTSGGVFTVLSDYVLKNGGVIYGTILDNDFRVKYIRTDNKKDRDKMRGSKYVQSDLNDTFNNIKKDLETDRLVLFVGNPCFVSGLKTFLNNKINNNLILCDIICHGVPSPLIFKEHINFINKKGNLNKYVFRDKSIGWRGTNTTIKYGNKVESNTSFSDIFTNLYFDGYISRDCCETCKFTSFNRVSDITIGDYWGIENVFPDFNDEKGINLLFLNTKNGINIFNKIRNSLSYIQSDINKCEQPQLKYPSKAHHNKDKFWIDYDNKGFDYVSRKYTVFGVKNKIIFNIKRFIPKGVKSKLKGMINK